VDQDSLISSVAAANPHTIVVPNTGGPVLMPWLDQIQGLFEAWYPRQEDGNAIAALLFGDVDPGARLPETFPRSQADIPTQSPEQYPGVNNAQGVPQSTYSEGLLVGYRWYDAKHITPLFPFGYGLDYTTFAYGGLTVTAQHSGSTLATVSITDTNIGQRAGADVPQMYIADPASTGEPPHQLKGYEHLNLAPSQSAQASFPINARALSYWGANGWQVAAGCYGIQVGHSEQDIAQSVTVSVNGASCPGAVASITVPSAGRVPRCAPVIGRLSGSRLGPVALGQTRARVHRELVSYRRRAEHDFDFYCLRSGAGIRVGYPSRRELRSLNYRTRRQLIGRAALLLAANRHYALGRERPGDTLRRARRAARLGRGYRVGRNVWYLLAAHGHARGVLRVSGGRVQEVGVADRSLTAGRRAAARFLRSFS
jgi:hypothetical protein